MTEKWHRHLGIYGICIRDNKLLVVHKTRGPYSNRYDLPGGSIEPNETLTDALRREFDEEAHCEIEILRQLGAEEFLNRFEIRDCTHIHHIGIFYEVKVTREKNKDSYDSNDTIGYDWVDIDLLNDRNSSPLVLKALYFLKGNP